MFGVAGKLVGSENFIGAGVGLMAEGG